MKVPELAARGFSLSVGLAATLAVLSPLLAMDADSFPISSYPMFARPRGQPTLFAAIGRTADGRERRLPASAIGSTEVLQTKVLIQRSVERGPEATRALCQRIAERLAGSSDGAGITSVEIVRRRYDPIAYFERGPQPIEEAQVDGCSVEPRAAPSVRSGEAQP